MGRTTLSALLVMGAVALGSAHAAEPDLRLAQGTEWPAGPIHEQLDADDTLIPFGKGAIFVPSMTNPLDEPPITVRQNGVPVLEGTTGTRIVLSPGTYEVRLGSGAVGQRLRYQASVREQHTTVIPVSWAGLTVHVVDERYGSLRSSYELIRVEDREYIGIGFGTDEQAGEPISTWVLRPGLYKIVRLGETYRARRDFATVRLVEGKHTHFLLVLNVETGEFAGAGEVPEEELFRPQDGFFGSLVLGGDVSFNSRSSVPGVEDGLYFAFRAFADARMSLEVLDNPLVLQLQVEQGQTKGPDLPWQKNNDRVDLDSLYIYRLKPWIGPYVRFGAETNILDGFQNFEDPTNVWLEGEDDCSIASTSRFKLSPPGGLTSLGEGAGLNLRLFKSIAAESQLRTGLGARHRIARDLFEQDRNPDPFPDSMRCPTGPNLRFRQIDTQNQLGIEIIALVTARITRWVLVNLELDSLLPFDGFLDLETRGPIVEFEGSVALKLTTFISINYVVRYRRDRALFEGVDPFQQDILLRFSLELL